MVSSILGLASRLIGVQAVSSLERPRLAEILRWLTRARAYLVSQTEEERVQAPVAHAGCVGSASSKLLVVDLSE